MYRRRFLYQTGVITGCALVSPVQALSVGASALPSMPDEAGIHRRTWMAFVANPSIWSPKQILGVFDNLALIARTIASYEPVSVLVSANNQALAERLMRPHESAYTIEFITCDVDDLWLRDTGPVFVRRSHNLGLAAIDFNFNGWGGKQIHTLDAQVAAFVARQAEIPLWSTELVLEGGCFEVDGEGTAIVTESCVLNDNRNPGWSAVDVEAELERLLGVTKVIWLKGIKGRDITDGHTDFYARFVRPGEVFVSRDNYQGSYDFEVTRDNITILSAAVDAQGRPLKLTVLDAPDQVR